MSHPFISIRFYHPFHFWREAKLLKDITRFSSFTCFYPHLSAKYSLNTVFPNTLDLFWSHNVRGKLSHLYKIKDNYISLYVNLYIFGEQNERRKILYGMLAVTSKAQSTPTLSMRTATNTEGK
jgi:hypothetical protein